MDTEELYIMILISVYSNSLEFITILLILNVYGALFNLHNSSGNKFNLLKI